MWGGEWLERLHVARGSKGAPLAKFGPEGEPVGESWLAGADNVVENGHLAGRSLADLVQEFGAGLVGTVSFQRYGPRMPLLAKLLDAEQELSVQVHPDDSYALAHEAASGHLGKSEAWYVLNAKPGASVLCGFKHNVTPAEVRTAIADGSLLELLNRVPVEAGDVIVNAAGVVHAVGAGVQLFEIQQASDLTYRLYDHGRVGADGQPRELHLERALAVADLRGCENPQVDPVPLGGGWWRLVARPEFVLDRLTLGCEAGATGSADAASLELLTLTRGQAELVPTSSGWQVIELRPGDTVLIPAALPTSYELRGEGELLRSAVVKAA